VSETAITIQTLFIIALAFTVAYWLGRNRSAKGRLIGGGAALAVGLPLGAWARAHPLSPLLRDDVGAFVFLALLITLIVVGVGLPFWALNDAIMSRYLKRSPLPPHR
jgi:hypothetical protein